MDDNDYPIFDMTDRGYRVRAHYVPKTLNYSQDAHVCITRDSELIEMGCYPAYRVWNIAAHFRDIVDNLSPPPERGER